MLPSDWEIYTHQDWFLKVFDNISDLVFFISVDENGDFRYLFMNELAKKHSGLTENAIGKTIHEVMPKHAADLIVEKYKDSIEEKKCITYEDYITADLSQNASYNPYEFEYFESKITPILNTQGICTHIIAIVRDITERKRKEKALRESEEKYRLIANNMTDLVSIIDINGIVRYTSPSYKSVLGYSPEKYIGNYAFDYLHPDEVEKIHNQSITLVVTKKPITVEFRHAHADGTWIWMEGKLSPVLDELGNTDHYLVVAREIMERKLFEKKLKHMAFHDPLTCLPNRRLFKSQLTQLLHEAKGYGQEICAMYMDIDKFKEVNDSLGHDVGDELLYQFSQRIKACLRKSDILARFGGDEFCALFIINQKADAIIIAEKIINVLQDKWKIQNHEFITTSSIGIAFYEKDMDHESLLKKADMALYQAKQKGRNNYQIYT